jgi:hypothetical protein
MGAVVCTTDARCLCVATPRFGGDAAYANSRLMRCARETEPPNIAPRSQITGGLPPLLAMCEVI